MGGKWHFSRRAFRGWDCKLRRVNSWHTRPADSRWLVFSSKADSDYTQLYLTRINDRGEATPPVWLQHMVAPKSAAAGEPRGNSKD
jgi:hypothetical protein